MKAARILVVWVGTLTRQQHIFTLVNFLAQSGFAVEIAHFGQDSSAQRPDQLDERIKLSSFRLSRGRNPASILSRLRSIGLLAQLLRRASYDIVYVINSWTLPIFRPVSFLVPRRCARVYHTFDWLEPGLHWRFYLALEKWACRGAGLVVNTDRTKARLLQPLYRLERCPLYLPNLLPKNASIPARTTASRLELVKGLSPPDPIVLIYPTIANQERLTLEILESLKRLPPNFVLATIAVDDPYGRQVRRLAESEGLRGRVKIYSPMSHDELVGLIVASDIGAIFHDVSASSGNFMGNPSRLPLFVACGIPFVAVATPNVEATVYKYGLGVCCDPTDPAELAAALLKLVNEPPGLAARREQLQRLFREELYFEKHAGDLLNELRAIAPKAEG